jgi:hypothetical protein
MEFKLKGEKYKGNVCGTTRVVMNGHGKYKPQFKRVFWWCDFKWQFVGWDRGFWRHLDLFDKKDDACEFLYKGAESVHKEMDRCRKSSTWINAGSC